MEVACGASPKPHMLLFSMYKQQRTCACTWSLLVAPAKSTLKPTSIIWSTLEAAHLGRRSRCTVLATEILLSIVRQQQLLQNLRGPAGMDQAQR